MQIYVLHENGVWVEPLRRQLALRGLPYQEWELIEGAVRLDEAPPEGVFYNRMSASSYTRDHRFSPDYAAVVLGWLERHGRRVVNSSRALQLEISKVAQYAALNAHGIATPRTIAAVGRQSVIDAATAFAPGPLILKPNRGGKGHRVLKFDTVQALRDYVASEVYDPPIDGVMLLQQYIAAPQPFITRAEFIGGRFFYAVRVDTSHGFELCPADVCASGDAFCPTTQTAPSTSKPRFEIGDPIDRALQTRFEGFLAANGIEIAGIEFVTDPHGQIWVYDVNTNTNYNAEAEARDGRAAMGEVARFLGRELALLSQPSRRLAVA